MSHVLSTISQLDCGIADELTSCVALIVSGLSVCVEQMHEVKNCGSDDVGRTELLQCCEGVIRELCSHLMGRTETNDCCHDAVFDHDSPLA